MEFLDLQVTDVCQYFALYRDLNRRRHLISDTKIDSTHIAIKISLLVSSPLQIRALFRLILFLDSQYVNNPFSEAQSLFLFSLLREQRPE